MLDGPRVSLPLVDPVQLFAGERLVISSTKTSPDQGGATAVILEQERAGAAVPASLNHGPVYTDIIWQSEPAENGAQVRLTIKDPSGAGVEIVPPEWAEDSQADLFNDQQSNGVFLPLEDKVIMMSRRTYTFEQTGLTVVFENSIKTEAYWQGRLRLFTTPQTADE